MKEKQTKSSVHEIRNENLIHKFVKVIRKMHTFMWNPDVRATFLRLEIFLLIQNFTFKKLSASKCAWYTGHIIFVVYHIYLLIFCLYMFFHLLYCNLVKPI